MNCREASHLFDADPQHLSPAQREAIHAHAASCPTCAAEWADWQALLALPVPATPASLWPRILAALPVRRAPPRRAFRPLVIGGVLLAGAALAAAWVEWGGRDAVPVSTAFPTVPASSSQSGVVADGAGAAVQGAAARNEVSIGDAPPQAVAFDPHRVLVLERPEAVADVRALALAAQCHDLIVRELRSFGGITLVADAAVPTPAPGRGYVLAPGRGFVLAERDRARARGLGAGKVVSISTDSGCQALLYDTASGAIISGASASGLEEGKAPVDVFAVAVAREFGNQVLLDPADELGQARAAVLDTSLGDAERVIALQAPQRSANPGAQDAAFFDAPVIAAAIRLGMTAADPNVRESVWSTLQQVKDPSLVKPLLQVLAKDASAQVRYQAALHLNDFLDHPGVREALRRAANEDPSSKPETVCCALTVREAAQRSLLTDKDFSKWVLDTLRDEHLPVRSRLILLQGSPDGRFRTFSLRDLGDDAARIVFDLGRRERDAGLRQMAWAALYHARPDDAFTPVLVEDLASHADEFVRAAAATTLAAQTDRPEVRAAFERAMNDPSIYVRRAAGAALGASGR